jgi:hypothetical protein
MAQHDEQDADPPRAVEIFNSLCVIIDHIAIIYRSDRV